MSEKRDNLPSNLPVDPYPEEGPTNREKQKAHGAQSDAGAEGQKTKGIPHTPPAYEGPEEKQQQRRSG